MTTPALAGAEFSGPTWSTWRIIARLIDGDAHLLSEDEKKLALKLTGRATLPTVPPKEMYIGAGRRSGKSRFSSLVCVWMAAQEYPALAPGETAVIANVAPDRRQAEIDLEYQRGMVLGSELLRGELVGDTASVLRFRHRTQLEVATASYRTVRGRTMGGAVIDESAFLRSETSALPDLELARALRPALLTLNGMLLVISSPHRKVGILFEAFKRFYGNDDATNLYIQADSRELNPSLNTVSVEQLIRDDKESADSEILGRFRQDITEYLPEADIDVAIMRGTRSLPPDVYRIQYVGFVDPSGGRHDAMTLGIAHLEDGQRVIVDRVLLEKPPFDPAQIVARFCEVLASYNVRHVMGDRFAGEWVASAFYKHGIAYEPSESDKSAIYMEVLPLFAQGLIALPDIQPLEIELRLLERRPRPGGRGDAIDHPRGACDDAANAALGAAWLATIRQLSREDDTGPTQALTDYDPLADRSSGRPGRAPRFNARMPRPDLVRDGWTFTSPADEGGEYSKATTDYDVI